MIFQHLPYLRHKRIILASGSPRRREIFTNLGLKYEVVTSTFDEKSMDKSAFASAADYVVANATNKAIEVASRLIAEAAVDSGTSAPDVVVGSDTVVVSDGRILEKPINEEDARHMLSSLSGRSHEVFTGVAVVLPRAVDAATGKVPRIRFFAERTEVCFAPLSPELIAAYIATGDPMDKAGSYGIQGAAASFVSKVNGCYFNVMGFPTHRFCDEIRTLIENRIL